MKSKSSLILSTAVLSFFGFWILCDSAWAFSGSGSGTVPDPYIITDVNQLQEMQNDLAASYVLGNDIDASGTVSWNGGAGFEPIGEGFENDPNNPFTGVFDGRGHTITGLYINRPTSDWVGMFGCTFGAEVKNVGMADVDITARKGVGALVNHNDEHSIIHNCWSSGSVSSTLVGQNTCATGGLVASNADGSIISRCYSTVTVTGTNAWQYGGLVGMNIHGGIIEDCYATGNVSGTNKVGGLVGDNMHGSEGGYVNRCYSTGGVTGNGGGLIGYNWEAGITYDSYWDTQTSGKTTSNGGTPKTTEQMKQQATFVGWDFVNTWDIEENVTYPFLREDGVSTGPIAHWKFDEGQDSTAYDSAGSNDGTIYGATWTTGQIGGALDFDGVDDYVDVGDPVDGSLDFGASDSFSISVWIKTSQEIPEPAGIVDKKRWVSAPVYGYYKEGYSLLVYQNKVAFGIEDISDNSLGINGNTIIDEGEWHHIVAVRDTISDKLYIYVDGISDATPVTDSTIGPLDTSWAFNIGRIKSAVPGPAYRHFPGTLDDVRIYDRALSEEEIQSEVIGGYIDWIDVAAFADRWLEDGCLDANDWCGRADINRDEDVDFVDFACLAQYWEDTPPVPGQASNPDPMDPSWMISTTADLSWTAGSDAAAHGVYLGTNPTTDANDFQGYQTATTFDPGFMIGSTTYYWRIDEVGLGGETTGDIWSFFTAPAPGPHDPIPFDGSTIDGLPYPPDYIYVVLTFDAGDDAVSHEAFFSDDEAKVIARDPNVSLGAAPDPLHPTEYYAGIPLPAWTPYNDSLVRGTIYYWCADETDSNDFVWPSAVWRFYVALDKASNPNPTDDAINISYTPTLSWTAGATEGFNAPHMHNIYFGPNEVDVNNATTASLLFRGNQGWEDTDWEPVADGGLSPLDPNTDYYWRIDEVHGSFIIDVIKGDVWSFTTDPSAVPTQASNPSPADTATGVSITADLSWTAGSNATSHDVYFGTDPTPDAGEFQGNDPCTLGYETIYYWRIDEVGPGGTTTGVVWRFTTESLPLPGQATNPVPADMVAGVSITADLSWTAGSNATSHDVYFGNDPTPDAGEFQGNQTNTTFEPGTLDYETTYYWRINEVGPGSELDSRAEYDIARCLFRH
jgi:hypothetical protein